MGPIVETRYGKLQGLHEGGALVFKGIPFAAPPIGRARFAPPSPPRPWPGVREATRFGAACPQQARRLQLLPTAAQGAQDEDCLYLNVWTPAIDAERRPVLVYLHGGSFLRGDGAGPMYAGAPLAVRAGIVVVTLNYRLGAFGFLSLAAVGGDRIGASANPGLLDQVAALRWVQENIEAFGGDPERVTVSGESAGAMAVGALLGVPAAHGTFGRAILQSGAANNVHTEEAAARIAEGFLRVVDIAPSQLERLRELPAPALLEAQLATAQALWRESDLLCFQPAQDPATLPLQPLEAIRSGAAQDVSLIVGTNREEWNFFAVLDPRVTQLTEEELRARVQARVGDAADDVLSVYARLRPQQTPGQRFCAIETDRVFRIPAIRLCEAQLTHCRDVFMYLFTQASPAFEGRLGACHALDLPFVFGHTGIEALAPLVGSGPAVERLSHRMMDAWAAFVRTGVPDHADLPRWPTYDLNSRATLLLGAECTVVEDPNAAEREIWEKLR